jgi:hypothetical protein
MQIIRECRMRAAILTGIAKDAPELRDQLLYVARKWLTLAALREQLNAGAGRAAHKLPCTQLGVPRLQKLRDQGSGTSSTGKFFMSDGSETLIPVIPL